MIVSIFYQSSFPIRTFTLSNQLEVHFSLKILHFFENCALFLKMLHLFLMGHFFIFLLLLIFLYISNYLIQNFSGRFDTSGSMIPLLVP